MMKIIREFYLFRPFACKQDDDDRLPEEGSRERDFRKKLN